MPFKLRSPAFEKDGSIPDRFTHKGANLSPPLKWHGAPTETKSFALVMEDPDAPRGVFHHWAVYDIPAETTELPEGATGSGPSLRVAPNDYGNVGYDGPQAPERHDPHNPHNYHVRLAALDVAHLDVEPQDQAEAIWQTAQPHIIAEAELVGTFGR